MGNCINPLRSTPEKAKVLSYNEVEKGYELIHYSLPPSTERRPAKVGCLLPHLMQPQHRSISFKIIKKESCQGRGIKILVSRQQLELLLRDAKMFQPMEIASGTSKRGSRKWRQSLSAIPEVPDL
ncbi:hypothetical protein DITRI_Ditri19aG0003800 [Diplodiscus trichospermus]